MSIRTFYCRVNSLYTYYICPKQPNQEQAASSEAHEFILSSTSWTSRPAKALHQYTYNYRIVTILPVAAVRAEHNLMTACMSMYASQSIARCPLDGAVVAQTPLATHELCIIIRSLCEGGLPPSMQFFVALELPIRSLIRILPLGLILAREALSHVWTPIDIRQCINGSYHMSTARYAYVLRKRGWVTPHATSSDLYPWARIMRALAFTFGVLAMGKGSFGDGPLKR